MLFQSDVKRKEIEISLQRCNSTLQYEMQHTLNKCIYYDLNKLCNNSELKSQYWSIVSWQIQLKSSYNKTNEMH
jgi:ribosomal protein L32